MSHQTKRDDLPRGIRNNNPGNIDASGIKWRGELRGNFERESRFEVFENPVWGVRALMRNLMTYQSRHGLNNVAEIINRWAPPFENDTGSYQHFVSKKLGVKKYAFINVFDKDTSIGLAKAIAIKENGSGKKFGYPEQWYPDELYQDAFDLAVGNIEEPSPEIVDFSLFKNESDKKES